MLDFNAHEAPRDVVMIHGAGGTNLVWRSAVKNLSGEARAFAVNLPGHPTGDIACKTIGEYADAVRGFIGESGLKAPVVCGHSMGSAIALTLGIDTPRLSAG